MSRTLCFELGLPRFPWGVDWAFQKGSGGIHSMNGALGSQPGQAIPGKITEWTGTSRDVTSGVLELC